MILVGSGIVVVPPTATPAQEPVLGVAHVALLEIVANSSIKLPAARLKYVCAEDSGAVEITAMARAMAEMLEATLRMAVVNKRGRFIFGWRND